MRVLALINPRSGTARALGSSWAEYIQEAFAARTIDATVRSVRGLDAARISALARETRAEAVVAGGGDGTIGSVAAALAGTDMPLGVLALGTMNNFAKDLRIPPSLADAIGVIAAGNVTRVDVGEVNGRVFVNNSSIGLYPRLVRRRDRTIARTGSGKWTALAIAMLKSLSRFPLSRVSLTIEGITTERTTPFVFVSNNAYDVAGSTTGRRSSLSDGLLSVYLPIETGRFGLLKLAVRGLIGWLDEDRDFDAAAMPQLTVETRKRRVHVSADGEVYTMRPPLLYRTRPGALRVFVPEVVA